VKGDELEQLEFDNIDRIIERDERAVMGVIENYKDEAVVRKAVEIWCSRNPEGHSRDAIWRQ